MKTKNKKDTKFAVISIKNHQMKVQEGKIYEIKKIEGEKGDKITVEDILLLSEKGETQIGKPTVEGAKAEVEIVEQKKGKKIRTYKYKAKSRHRKRYGIRPRITVIKVNKIEA